MHAGCGIWGLIAGGAFAAPGMVNNVFGPLPGTTDGQVRWCTCKNLVVAGMPSKGWQHLPASHPVTRSAIPSLPLPHYPAPPTPPCLLQHKYGFIMGGDGSVLAAALLCIVVVAACTTCPVQCRRAIEPAASYRHGLEWSPSSFLALCCSQTAGMPGSGAVSLPLHSHNTPTASAQLAAPGPGAPAPLPARSLPPHPSSQGCLPVRLPPLLLEGGVRGKPKRRGGLQMLPHTFNMYVTTDGRSLLLGLLGQQHGRCDLDALLWY